MQLSANAPNCPSFDEVATAKLRRQPPRLQCRATGNPQKCAGHKKTHRVAAAGFAKKRKRIICG
jgi:hypothetical protein